MPDSKKISLVSSPPALGEFMNPEKILKEIGVEGGQKIADLGSGPGFYALPAAQIVGSTGLIYVIDILPHVLKDVETKAEIQGLHNLRFVRANLEIVGSTGIPADSCDWVFLVNILHQAKPLSVLGEASRILKKGGKVLVIDWGKVASPFGPPKEQRIDELSVLKIAKGLKLKKEGDVSAGTFHYGLILVRV